MQSLRNEPGAELQERTRTRVALEKGLVDLSSPKKDTQEANRSEPKSNWLDGDELSSSLAEPASKTKTNVYTTGLATGLSSDYGSPVELPNSYHAGSSRITNMREDMDGLSSSPAVKLPPSKVASISHASKAAQAARNHWVTLDLSSASNSSPQPVSKITTASKRLSSSPQASVKPAPGSKGGKDFVFLDDDFDTTLLSDDDPFASPPPAKRVRLSSPKAGQQPKSAGYSRSLSNIESSKAVPKSRESGYQRSSSNIKVSNKPSGISRSKIVLNRNTSKISELDPLVFTSSSGHAAAAKRRNKIHLPELSDSEDISDHEPKATKGKGTAVAVNLDEDSSDIETLDISTQPKKVLKKFSADAALAKYEDLKANGTATQQKAEKAKEKTEKSRLKKEEKEAEVERKKEEKEAKAREKDRAANLARVNVLKTDKKKSTEEMIVDLPSCLTDKLTRNIQTFLGEGEVKAEFTEWESLVPVVKWRRKVVAKFNFEADLWEPVAPTVEEENHVMCILTATEFVDLVVSEEGRDLDSYVLRLQSKHHGKILIFLLEGITAWFRKNRTVKDRQFKDAVRSYGAQGAPPAACQKSRKKKEAEYVDEDKIEAALLQLQLEYNAVIHHTNAMPETAEWVWTFTQHISTIPYKNQKNSLDAAFCMESGQVKAGEDVQDTYTKMLQEISRITASVAYGIAAEYPTLHKLIEGLKKKGPLALEDCEKSANKDGAFSGKRIGPAISKRVYKVLLGRDPGSWDV